VSGRELFIKLAKILEHYLFVSGIAKMVVMGGIISYVAGVPRVVFLSVTYMESIR